MQLALASWNNVTPNTIANCWRHTGIIPPHEYSSMAVPPPDPRADESVVDNIAAELNLDPEYTYQEVFDMLQALQMDLPTEEDLSVQQILQDMNSRVSH
ncbi:hypothetical protein OPQ81_005259 [Rhizoctonia solani]|nr:hypothetical protein OPQ81_005259 [Rhizoctonia solani]